MPQATFWVDSMNVVFWIHGQSLNCKPFLSHRVREIHEKSNRNQWRYVPNKQNPADHGTRGGQVRTKRYLCLFRCLQTHCCHLEMATALDTAGFLKLLQEWQRDEVGPR